jgi:hypothetical protein
MRDPRDTLLMMIRFLCAGTVGFPQKAFQMHKISGHDPVCRGQKRADVVQGPGPSHHSRGPVSQEKPVGVVDGSLQSPSGEVLNVRTIWIVETGKRAPRFVTAYPV